MTTLRHTFPRRDLEPIKLLKFVLHVPDVSILLVHAAALGIRVMFRIVGLIILLASSFGRLVLDVVVGFILALFPAGGAYIILYCTVGE